MKKTLLLLFLFSTLFLTAQKEANIWYFGRNAGLDFNTSPPTVLNDGLIDTLEGCSSFSDENGNLLFYSDGITVWNKNHTKMNFSDGTVSGPGGRELLGNPSSTQSGMIIPLPKSTDIYYLFTVDDNNGNNGLNYYTIDMSKNGGNGEIINGPINLSGTASPNWTEKVTAVKGTDCDTYWVVSGVNNEFYAFKITDRGVELTPVRSNVSNSLGQRGYLKLSPDGTKIAVADQGSTAFLYNFNASNGQIDNTTNVRLNDFGDGEPYGLEFSVDSRKLYLSTVSQFRGTLTDPESTYKLFQYDLKATDISASKSLIHQQTPGFRGALQLGPDGKIYATIPLAYDDPPNGDARFLDVIENPTADASDVIFTKDAINLNGKFSTQGLPPFISSLLLPFDITTGSTTNLEILTNKTENRCIGSTIKVTPDNSKLNAVGTINYEWFFDNGTGNVSIASTKDLTLTNLQTSNTGKYTLKTDFTNKCGETQKGEAYFNLGVYQGPNAITTNPNDIYHCDITGSGLNTFDLTTTTNQVLNGQDPTVFEVKYFLSQADADAYPKSTPITVPYKNPTAFSNQTIFARIHNKTAPDACYETTSFTLAVTGKPKPTTPVNYEACDDSTAPGNDIDGFYNAFRLDSKDAEILGTLPAAIYSVTYHTTLAGAQTDSTTNVIDKTTNYRNTTKDSQDIYVRVENINNVACNDTSVTFKLIVNPLPTVTSVVNFRHCSDNPDPTVPSNINLTLNQPDISLNHANETFEYYTSLANLTAGIQITNKTAHPALNGDKVYVKILSNKNCSRTAEIDITIGYSDSVTYNRAPFAVCDDYLDIDGNNTVNNNDTDGITNFDISTAVDDIKTLFPAAVRPDLEVLIFETTADRDALINNIPTADLSNYRNKNVPAITPQPLYVKIVNTVNNDCQGISQFNIWAQQPPTANKPNDLSECDDDASGSFTDGITKDIDISNQITEALGALDPNIFKVTLHHSPTDANTGNRAITNLDKYTNITPFRETIYVRIENVTTGCFNDHETFDIIINPIPEINKPNPIIEICDQGKNDGDTRNGLAQDIPLQDYDALIINNRTNADRYEVNYHKNRTDAFTASNPLNKNYDSDRNRVTFVPATPISDRPSTETLFVSLKNLDTGCINGITTIEIKVYPEPVLDTNITPYTDCDNITDSQNDDTNGINGDINLSSKIPEILVNYNAADHANFTVTFYDEDDEVIKTPDNYENIKKDGSPNTIIKVEVTNNKKPNCTNNSLTFDIVINPLPTFDIVDYDASNPFIVCLDNPTTTNDNVGLEIEVTPDNVYEYTWYNEADLTTVLSKVAKLTVYKGGQYRVVAKTKDGTACERIKTFEVKESISPILENKDIIIVDDTNNNSLDLYSIKINTENNNLGIGDYQFSLIKENGDEVGPQNDPLFENIEGGIYTVKVNDKNGCAPDAFLKVSVIEYPKFLTPNNDGINDTWKIKGANSDFYPSSNIHVFDRFGKIVAIIPIDSLGWNGTYKGKQLPSTDYWFKVMLVDKEGNQHLHQGHFSLIRR